MTAHPYLASTPDPFVRLVRAHFWLINDPDFRNADYWRGQVAECEERVSADFRAQHITPDTPAELAERREALLRHTLGEALRCGYGHAGYHRGGTDVPTCS